MGMDLHIVSRSSSIELNRREGIVTVIIGAATFFILPRDPATAKFLSEDEKQSVLLALREDRACEDEQEDFRWGTCLDALRAPQMWLMFAQLFSGGSRFSSSFDILSC